MNFYTIRYFILAVCLIFILIIKKKGFLKFNRAKIIICLLILYTLCFLPYEITFLNFSNLKSAFKYSFPKYQIWGTLESNADTFVLYKKNHNYFITYFHKNENEKWDFNNPLYQNNTSSTTYEEYSILKFKTKSNKILLVVIPYDNKKNYNVLDLNKESFKSYGDGFANYYLKVINNYNDKYYVYINDEKIWIK